jgi:peroxiredoxin
MKFAIAVFVTSSLSFTALASEPAKAEALKAEAAPAGPQVTETPADKLGTLAPGFGLAVGTEANATLTDISVDVPNEGAKTQAKNGVPFAILSDSKLVAHKAFKVMRTPGADEAKALAGYGIDLKAYSGETHGSFAVPSMFFVDKKGIIRFAHADEDYKTRPSTKQMIEIAEKLSAK